MFVENTLGLGLGCAPGQRQLRKRRIDGERLQRFVVVPGAVGEESGDLRASLELRGRRRADVCAEFDGQSAMRPRPGALVESSRRSGLSQTSVSSRLLNHEPSYATRTMPRLFIHSAPTLKSFVRES